MPVVPPFFLTSASWIKWKSLPLKWSLIVSQQIHAFRYKKKTLSLYIVFIIVPAFLNSFLSSAQKKAKLLSVNCCLQVAFKQVWYNNAAWLVWNLSFSTSTGTLFLFFFFLMEMKCREGWHSVLAYMTAFLQTLEKCPWRTRGTTGRFGVSMAGLLLEERHSFWSENGGRLQRED